jgi:hypothetical protein
MQGDATVVNQVITCGLVVTGRDGDGLGMHI